MHYWRCVHSIEPSDLTFCFCILNPRGRQTLAKLSLQPHWLKKQTEDVTRQAPVPPVCLHTAQHPRETEKPNQTHKQFLDLSPAVVENSRYFQQQYLVQP